MKTGIRFRLFIVSLAMILVSLAAADAYLMRGTEKRVVDAIRTDLLVRATLVARDASAFTKPTTDIKAWDSLADDLGRAAEGRVTFVLADGTVIGDSEVDVAEVPHVESHGTRPEVVNALRTGQGDDMRLSATISQRMLYVAVPFQRDGAALGVARVARPLSAVDEATAQQRSLIFGSAAFALVFAVALSSIAAQRSSRAIRELIRAARRMTAGDLEVRTRPDGQDEVAELGRALDQLAASLKGTLQELRSERDLQVRIMEGMQEGVLVLDGNDRVVMMNQALRAMLLLGADSRGKPLIEVVRHAELEELIERAKAEKTIAPSEIDLPGIKPRRLLVHASALAGEGGGLLAVCVDVTDLRRLESLRRDFVANVSHELRTPVTAVLSAAETLTTSALSDKNAAIRFVGIINRNALRLQSLIDDLLELSRLESNQFRLKDEQVDLPSVVGIVLGLFREKAEQKGVKLAARIPKAFPTQRTDQRAVEQVLSNLVDNAIKYCPSGSSVTVSAAEEPGEIRLSVVDTGLGIDPKHLPRLFERFYRVDAGRSRDAGGTGLGLSIVKHLAEAMGGRVEVESTVGKGSTFSCWLPRADS